MFRRNKKKKDNKSADTIALTSPQVESSSGVEPIATKSKGKGGFLGRRKKKATNTNNNGNNFVRNSSKISGNDTNPTISDSSIKNDVSSNNKRQIETGSIAQHDIIIPETTAVSTINKRSTSNRSNKKSTALPQRSTTQKIQQQPKSQSSTKKSNSIPPPLSDTINRGNTKNSTGISSTAKSAAVVTTSKQQPQAAGSIQNNNFNNNTNSVPMTRSGWSMLSNESTAMNSENYIESLDNLSVRSGKVSFYMMLCVLIECAYMICTFLPCIYISTFIILQLQYNIGISNT